ncbi:MAG: hypothetical protein ABJA66_17800 [Actinomycetota bacterium]
MTAKEQNKLAGIFLMVHGGLQTLLMLFMCVFYGIFGAAVLFGGRKGEDQMFGVFFIAMIAFIFIFSIIFIIPQIIGGWKLYKEKPNARIWGIIGSIFACISFPLGTAAGVFGMVFLFGDEGTRFYLNENRNLNYLPNSEFAANASDFVNKSPDYVKSPPPNSWQ